MERSKGSRRSTVSSIAGRRDQQRGDAGAKEMQTVQEADGGETIHEICAEKERREIEQQFIQQISREVRHNNTISCINDISMKTQEPREWIDTNSGFGNSEDTGKKIVKSDKDGQK